MKLTYIPIKPYYICVLLHIITISYNIKYISNVTIYLRYYFDITTTLVVVKINISNFK